MYTFEVYPSLRRMPLASEVIRLAGERIRARLQELNIEREFSIDAVESENVVRGTRADWPLDRATSFSMVGEHAKVSMVFHDNREDLLLFRDEIRLSQTLTDQFIDECLAIGRMWLFKSSAGHSAMAELLFGYLAGAVAELTEGFVYSDDGAWERAALPMRSEVFYATYLRLTNVQNDSGDRSRRWLAEISDGRRG